MKLGHLSGLNQRRLLLQYLEVLWQSVFKFVGNNIIMLLTKSIIWGKLINGPHSWLSGQVYNGIRPYDSCDKEILQLFLHVV